MPVIRANPKEQAALSAIAAMLNLYLGAAESFRLRSCDDAVPPTPIGRANTNKHLSWHYDLADMRMRGVVDHTDTILTLLNAGIVPRVAVYTLLRAMVEADAVAYWLLQPDSIEELRFRRIIDRGCQQFHKLQAEGLKTTVRAAGVARQVRATVPAAAKKATTINALEAAKQSRPGMTAMTKQLLGSGTLYHWLSGYAHAENWAVAYGLKGAGAVSPTASWAITEANVPRIISFISLFVLAHERVQARWIALSGAEQAEWDSLRDAIPANV